jgi:hypothetical protein
MMNFIYSVFKRSNVNNANGNNSYLYRRFIFGTILLYAVLAFIFLMSIEHLLFEFGSETYEIFIGLFCAFILLYPLFYGLLKGYKYLDYVNNYSITKAFIISSLIAVIPALLISFII